MLRTYEWENAIIGEVSKWNSQILRIERYSPTPFPNSHSYSVLISSVHASVLWSLCILFPSVSPSSSHTNKTNGNLLSLSEFKMYLPSLEFSVWLYLLLSLALSHRWVEVWAADFSSCTSSDWVWLIRGKWQNHLIEPVRRMTDEQHLPWV